MLDVTIYNVKSLLGLGLIKIIPTYPITKEAHFKLIVSLKVVLSDGRVLEIPEGFTFDGSSAPRFIWWLFPSYGDFLFAALIHDYLYHVKYLSDEVGFDLSQKYADDEMLLWSNELNNKKFGKRLDNKMRHKAVRWFGKKQYLD